MGSRNESMLEVSKQVSHLLEKIKDCLADHKAHEVVVIELGDKSSIADYMVIASGRSHRQVGAISEHISAMLKGHGVYSRTEGLDGRDWVLLDAGDIIVHIFRPEVRSFYNLEKMWSVKLPKPEQSVV